jgi:hypothetical protein
VVAVDTVEVEDHATRASVGIIEREDQCQQHKGGMVTDGQSCPWFKQLDHVGYGTARRFRLTARDGRSTPSAQPHCGDEDADDGDEQRRPKHRVVKTHQGRHQGDGHNPAHPFRTM